jgi:hypothetical protein
MYMMSFFEVPKGILKKLDFYISIFFLQGGNHKEKYNKMGNFMATKRTRWLRYYKHGCTKYLSA